MGFGGLSPFRMSVLAIATGLAISGCVTPERRAALDHCEGRWLDRIPPVFETHIVIRERLEEVPDGGERCTTDYYDGRTVTECRPTTKTVLVEYEAEEIFDRHARERNARIGECAAQLCLESHGNVACE